MPANKTTNIPLGQSKWNRMTGQGPNIMLKNRFFETNPANQVDQVSFLARPGLKPYQSVGVGPIRNVYVQPGSFDDDLFVVSGTSLYRVDNTTDVVTFIGAGIFPGTGKVNMCATGTLNGVPEFLFLADGRNLWLYIANSFAVGTLTGVLSNNDIVVIGTTYYQITSGSVDAGTPDGSSANPWLIALGATPADPFANLSAAITNTGESGVQYSSGNTINNDVTPIVTSTDTLKLQSNQVGGLGNSEVTTTTSTTASWANATLTGGGTPTWTTVQTPDDVGIADVCYTSDYVIAVAAQGQGVNGRFYWVMPGDTTIDPLNFATAERAPDPIVQCIAVGDQFWLLGTNSTEVWYPTGDNTAPFQRVQGRLFDKGIWSGTAVQIKDQVVVVGRDGYVYSVTDSPQVISTPAISEQIRVVIRAAEGRFISD